MSNKPCTITRDLCLNPWRLTAGVVWALPEGGFVKVHTRATGTPGFPTTSTRMWNLPDVIPTVLDFWLPYGSGDASSVWLEWLGYDYQYKPTVPALSRLSAACRAGEEEGLWP